MSDMVKPMIFRYWVPGRRQVLGITLIDKLEPRERLGKLMSTLGTLKSAEKGAVTYGGLVQHWPEFRSKTGLLIQRAFLEMTYERRCVMDMFYAWSGIPEFPIKMRADKLGMSVARLYSETDAVNSFVSGFMASAKVPKDEFAF